MNTLIIGATHGDEPIGVRALNNLATRRTDFDWVIGNVPALEQGTRLFEADLNRSAPGSLDSDIFEERRAAELIELSKRYDETIDIHGTTNDTGLFIILTKLSKETLTLAARIPVERIVYWPAISPELEGPVSEYMKCALEIECGPKDDPVVQQELEAVLETYLDTREQEVDVASVLANRACFEVFGSLEASSNIELAEWQEVTINENTFTPLLVGVYKDSAGVGCYQMKRVTDLWSRLS